MAVIYRAPGVLPCFEHIDLTTHRYGRLVLEPGFGAWFVDGRGSFIQTVQRRLIPPLLPMEDKEAARLAGHLVHLVAEHVPLVFHIADVWRDAERRFGCGPGMFARQAECDSVRDDEVLVINGDRHPVGTWVTNGGEHGLCGRARLEGEPPAALLYRVVWADRFEREVGV